MREKQLNELDRMNIHPIYKHSEETIYLYSHANGSKLVATFSTAIKYSINTNYNDFHRLDERVRLRVLAIIIDFYTLELEQEMGLS